jgi:hypothetical protein
VNEIANVQYSAILLRTVDLIHVTKDRTPSVMYQTIRFSDLKSIDEWDKQISTFSVHMRSREFNPTDFESHVIEVVADFTEERPFFALTEYLSWADSEIRQSKQWADASQQKADAKEFSFPWRAIRGDIRVEGNLPRQMRFELDRGRLLDLLVGHTIYNEPTVAVRELLQNAIDAVRFQYYLDQKIAVSEKASTPTMGYVHLKWDADQKELVVQDNGIGMDLNAIENHLLRVGASFYDTPQFHSENQDFSPISRFGIGILTCFMISDNIEIITCRNGEGRRIRMSSVHADYLLKDLTSGSPELADLEPHGTRVRLILRPSVDLEKKTMLEIVRQWVIMPACDVLYSEANEAQQAIGVKDIGDAARGLYVRDGKRSEHSEDFDLVSLNLRSDDSPSYEVAIVVNRSGFPERNFVTEEKEERQAAAVCIEGIRADSHLPGFKTNLCALLSVRNNKRFRTTVSRESLETDEEYNKVALLCADALFDHIRNEVKRISNLEGKPLLQASTTGRVIFRRLLSACDDWGTYDKLNELYKDLPLVVIEGSTLDAGGLPENRELRSLNEIAKLDEFWTIESRTVDYLGVISRDLGRELNISNFLGRLAPELYESTINPIVVDAEAFAEKLRESDSVVQIKFSRKHQRTLLRWKAVGDQADHQRVELDDLDIEGFRRAYSNFGLDTADIRLYIGRVGSRKGREVISRRVNKVVFGEIEGDIEGVRGVRTRIVTMLRRDTETANHWQKLRRSWMLSRSVLSSYERSVLAVGMVLFSAAASNEGPRYSWRPDNMRQLVHPWTALSPELNRLLQEVGIEDALPLDLQEIIGPSDGWFDASSFWLDWAELDQLDNS